MNPERGEFLNAEDWCTKCWEEFTRLNEEEQEIWEFIVKRNKMLRLQEQREQERPLILCENDGTLFETIQEAAAFYKMTPTSVFAILRGIPNYKKGLVFSYYRK